MQSLLSSQELILPLISDKLCKNWRETSSGCTRFHLSTNHRPFLTEIALNTADMQGKKLSSLSDVLTFIILPHEGEEQLIRHQFILSWQRLGRRQTQLLISRMIGWQSRAKTFRPSFVCKLFSPMMTSPQDVTPTSCAE